MAGEAPGVGEIQGMLNTPVMTWRNQSAQMGFQSRRPCNRLRPITIGYRMKPKNFDHELLTQIAKHVDCHRDASNRGASQR
jgi:hypothetical protein